MRRTVSLLCVVGLAVAPAAGRQAGNERVEQASTTAAKVAMLAADIDSLPPDEIGKAIASDEAKVRAVAARLAAVAADRRHEEALAAAFERERDALPMIEQGRALLVLRGAAVRDTIERRLDTSPDLAVVYSEWIARTDPGRLAEAIPLLRAKLRDQTSSIVPHVSAALRRQSDGGVRLLRAWLANAGADAWRASLQEIDWSVGQYGPVLIEAIGSSDSQVREATIWNIVGRLVEGRAVDSTLLAAAAAATAPGDVNAITWEQFGREVLARHIGRETPERSALLRAEGERHGADVQKLARFEKLHEAERRVLKAIVGTNLPLQPPAGARNDDVRETPGLAMRLLPSMMPGLLASMLETTSCRPERKRAVAFGTVTYRPDGHVATVAVEETGVSEACVRVFAALARLTLSDMKYALSESASESFVLPLDPDYVTCTATSPPGPPAALVGKRSAGRVRAPTKVHHVQPLYPSVLQKQGVEGSVMVEAVISESGCVPKARAIRAPHPLLAFSALWAVSGWRFTPTTVEEIPVPVVMTVAVDFKLSR